MSSLNDQQPGGYCEPDPLTGRCITCSDEATEGRVVALCEGDVAAVELPGGTQEIAIELLETLSVGDRVLVHAGVAIANLGR